MLEAIRFVHEVSLVTGPIDPDVLPAGRAGETDLWVVHEAHDTWQKRAHAKSRGLEYRVLREKDLRGFPVPPFCPPAGNSVRKRVVVTGCFDWFHSGHVRFFEEASTLGDLFVVVGQDANIRLLKGEGHPLASQDERRYMVNSVRFVTAALVSTGQGWLDAEPEIAQIKPDIYVVNGDGDKPEKKEFCEAHGIRYVVLRRTPKEGLPKRSSTDLRGF
jgi:cytidyltransferase-like protein